MKIVTLLENETLEKKYQSTHGLSLYIEIYNTKILFDIGPNNYYIKNAKKLGVNLEEVDFVVISHGHHDHGTGIKQFLKLNQKAEVYISDKAFNKHAKMKSNSHIDIGIGKKLNHPRVHYITESKVEVTPCITICNSVKYKKQIIRDKDLLAYENNQFVEDHFEHEIYMVISEEDNNVLFTGCSHKGIEHIVDSIEDNCNILITHIIGGLHFAHYDSFDFQQTDYLQKLGRRFSEDKDVKIFACHCTGDEAFFELKQSLKEDIKRLKTGSIIEI